MKIGNSAQTSPTPQTTRVRDSSDSAERDVLADSFHAINAADRAVVSPLSARALDAIRTPENKLDELRLQFQQGTYSLDATKISKKIIDASLDK